jgi:hypothetical protein
MASEGSGVTGCQVISRSRTEVCSANYRYLAAKLWCAILGLNQLSIELLWLVVAVDAALGPNAARCV